MRVIGIDPGNDRAGISFWEDGRLLSSATVFAWNPWEVQSAVPLRWLETSARTILYVEVPQNGTHASRGGVHWAAGMLVAPLVDLLGVPRSRVVKVTPSVWRRGLGLPTRGQDKQRWIDAARAVPGAGQIASHDEAEAVLIGRFGSEQEEG